MKHKYKLAILFGVSHGINDFIVGYLLALLSATQHDIQFTSIAFLIYAFIAFGGQVPVGILIDKIRQVKSFSLMAILLMIGAIVVSYFNVFLAILLSAMASAMIHVCGGAVCYQLEKGKSTLAGIFTSPGVVGLIIGGILGASSFAYFYVFILLLFVILFLLSKIDFPFYDKSNSDESSTEILDTHDFVMLILLLSIALRSLFWNIFHIMNYGNNLHLLSLATAAFLGKIIGGYFSDKIGWKKWIFVTLLLSVFFLTFGKQYFPLVCVGIACLQSAVPITMVLVQHQIKNSPATGAGLALGFSIILAGLPSYVQQFRNIQTNTLFLLVLSMVFVFCNGWILRKYKSK